MGGRCPQAERIGSRAKGGHRGGTDDPGGAFSSSFARIAVPAARPPEEKGGTMAPRKRLAWLAAVSVVAGLTLVITAGTSGAAPKQRGTICSPPSLQGRGFQCADMSV